MAAKMPSPLDVISVADFQQICYESIQYKLPKYRGSISLEQLRDSLTVNVQHILNPGGYMGDYYRIRIAVNAESSLPQEIRAQTFEYFVKTLPYNDATNLAVVRLGGMATRESHMYAELLPKLQGNACKI